MALSLNCIILPFVASQVSISHHAPPLHTLPYLGQQEAAAEKLEAVHALEVAAAEKAEADVALKVGGENKGSVLHEPRKQWDGTVLG